MTINDEALLQEQRLQAEETLRQDLSAIITRLCLDINLSTDTKSIKVSRKLLVEAIKEQDRINATSKAVYEADTQASNLALPPNSCQVAALLALRGCSSCETDLMPALGQPVLE